MSLQTLSVLDQFLDLFIMGLKKFLMILYYPVQMKSSIVKSYPKHDQQRNNETVRKNTSDFAAISICHTFFSFFVFPAASFFKLAYFSSMPIFSAYIQEAAKFSTMHEDLESSFRKVLPRASKKDNFQDSIHSEIIF